MNRSSLPAAAAGCLLLAACGDAPPPAAPSLPPPEIHVVDVIQRDQPIHIELVGETRGSSDIPIRTRVQGILLGVHFTEGTSVQEGDLLYTIDPLDYETKVVEAEGFLAEANTALEKARADLKRIEPLAAMGAASQADLDGARAQFEAAISGVQVNKARVKQAEIQLGYTEIAAPISGRIGISEATVGEFVGQTPNPVVLNFISLVDPIRVRFSIDERTYLRLARKFSAMDEDQLSEMKQNAPSIALILADGTRHPHLGRRVAADAAVDPKTGTFMLEADFPNPDNVVIAGQFARVRVQIDEIEDALLVPQRAINELQGIFQIYVVGPDNTVTLRAVELGPAIDRLRVVSKGLNPGERVAMEFARLRPGMTVVPRPAALNEDGSMVAPAPAQAPAGT